MYRVLLVEDEEIELETLRDYIDWKKNGISRVFTARNGRRALECLEENMADIVITDIQMPGMSGIELAETIVRRGYPCKIVFLSGYDDFSYIHSAFQVNAVDYLLKPFTIEEVEACLKKVRSELEKSEIADWSRKTAAKQLLEMALREKQEIGIHAVRGGGIVGEHTVLFVGDEEVIEIKHHAQSKRIFAAGAVRAALFAAEQKPGIYSMKDVLWTQE